MSEFRDESIFIINEAPSITVPEIANTIDESVSIVEKHIKQLKDEGILDRELFFK